MPPNDALGLGGQKIGDFLSLADTPALRTKYYDTLQGGLDAATTPAQPDQGNLLWQGIIPALATALLTKGKSLGFSGAPLLNVLKTEQDRADTSQKLSVEAKLKGAGLFGEELGRRETLATATANKEEDRQTRKELADQSNQTRIDIANQSDATRREVASMMGADRQDRADERREKLTAEQAEKYGKSISEDLKTRKYGERYEALQSAKSAMSQVEGPGGKVATLPLKEAITRYYITGGRQAKALIEGLVPKTLQGEAESTLNWIQSTNENTIPPAQMKGLKALIDAADLDLSNELQSVSQAHKSRAMAEAPLAAKAGVLDVYTDPSQAGYGGLQHLGQAGAAPGQLTPQARQLLFDAINKKAAGQ